MSVTNDASKLAGVVKVTIRQSTDIQKKMDGSLTYTGATLSINSQNSVSLIGDVSSMMTSPETDVEQLKFLKPCQKVQEEENTKNELKVLTHEAITQIQKEVLNEIQNTNIYLNKPVIAHKCKSAFLRWGNAGEMAMDVLMVEMNRKPIYSPRLTTLDGQYLDTDEKLCTIKPQGIDGIYVDESGYHVYLGEAKSGTSKLGNPQDKSQVNAFKKYESTNKSTKIAIKNYYSKYTILKKRNKKGEAGKLTPEELASYEQEPSDWDGKLVPITAKELAALMEQQEKDFKYEQHSANWYLDRLVGEVGEECAREIENRITLGYVHSFVFRFNQEARQFLFDIEEEGLVTRDVNANQVTKNAVPEQNLYIWKFKT